MVSTVRPRPNHYELLGLAPSASSEEIAQAFARQVSISRPMAETAQMSIAYETLRNPAKRRAYDASLGFGLMPQPVQSPAALTYSISAHFIGTAGGGWLDAEGERRPAEEAQSPASAEPEPFIAAAPTSPLHPTPGSEPPPQHPSQAEAERILQSKVHDFLASERVREDRSRDAEDRSAGWSRTGVAIGVILLVAALVGAWAGMDAGNAEEPKPAEHAAKAALAPPMPAAKAMAFSSAPAPGFTAEREQRPERQVERAKPSRQIAASKERVAAQSLDSGYYPSPSAETTTVDASGVASAQTVAANLPIPNKVAARTIERLGYGCGEIASTTAVDGDAPGVYRVTCTSGQSYRAAPVRGRYRFRRLDH